MATDDVVGDPRHTLRASAVTDALAGSVARAAGAQNEVEFRHGPPGDGWWRCGDLVSGPDGLTAWRERLSGWLRSEYGVAPARTVDGYLASWYLRVPAYAGALLWHHERRVPPLRPERLAVRLASQGRPHPVGIAVAGESFACLPWDPCAGRPEATVVPDERALAAVLRGRFVEHAARFVRVHRGRFGPRTLWAAATDALDGCLWSAGVQGGDEGAGVADAALVLGSRFAPLTSATTLRKAGGAEPSPSWSRRRESCCFTYLLPGGSECGSCPRLHPANPAPNTKAASRR